MARTVRDSKLETREARNRLSPRPKPYWRTLRPGELHLGYGRRRKDAPGYWAVRTYIGINSVPKGKSPYKVKALNGVADDFEDANGETVLSYAQAQDIALAQRHAAQGVRAGPMTVADAVAEYIQSLANGGRSTADAESRAKLHILPTLGSFQVASLTVSQLQLWLAGLARAPAHIRAKDGAPPRNRSAPQTEEAWRRRKSTANRTLNVLKAALNHAFDAESVRTNDAWGRRLKSFRQVDASRKRFLTVAEARRLINAADPNCRDLAHAALQTGARYGELARMLVSDFNPDSGTVAIGKSKSGKARHVFLTPEGTAFFRQLSAGRPGDEVLLRMADGGPWGKSEQLRPMAAAVKRAKITPPISFHGLRHTYASLSVMGGVPLQVVAHNLGHVDTRMVERHYGHLEDSYVRKAIRAGAPRWGMVGRFNVTPLRAKRTKQ
jgi:integrase